MVRLLERQHLKRTADVAKKNTVKPAQTQVEEITDALTKRKKPETVKIKDLLSTGSTLLNLACSGKSRGGLSKGHYYHFVGDSESGKSFITCTCFAEAAINDSFHPYTFVYDNAEDGMLADVEYFFGRKTAERILPPNCDKNGPKFSSTIEEFYFHLEDALKCGPCIYVLDSIDALGTDTEAEQFQDAKIAHEKGKEGKGTYGTARAKINSSYIRQVLGKLKETGSILIIISQTRDNIGFGSQFNPKVSGGGHALKFYATLQLWSSVKREEKTDYNGKSRSQGIIATVKVKKNRQTGRKSSVDIPIYWSTGIDDVGGNIDYLIEEGHWTETKKVITASEWDIKGNKKYIVEYVEENDLQVELAAVVSKVWNEIEAAVAVQRKSRYES